MVRMVLARSLVMTGLAFTVGLLVGLCLHLPGASSPGQGRLLRVARRAREAPEDGLGSGMNAAGALRRIQSTRNASGATGKPGRTADTAAVFVEGHKLRLQEKVRAIEATYASIAAVKSGQVPLEKALVGTEGREKDPQRHLPQEHKAEEQGSPRPSPTPQQTRHSRQQGGRVFLPGRRDQRREEDPEPSGPRSDTPVYGRRTVRVMVTGGQAHAPPPPPPGPQETSQAVVNDHNSGRHPSPRTEAPSSGDRNVARGRRRHKGSDVMELRQEEFTRLEDLVTGGIYWSEQVEMLVPPGFSDNQAADWRRTVEKLKVVRMEEGCGRMQNRRLTLEDGRQACARYRVNTDQMQGEIYSYYLSRLLGISNLPPTVLGAADTASDPRWSLVETAAMRAQWSAEKPVVLTPWMDQLRPAYIPRELRDPSRRDSTGNIDIMKNLHPSRHLLANRTLEQLAELVQWSDLLVFDFLTANVDRVVNNMFNLQWNTEMMSSPAHNLEARAKDNLLVFLDNESGLFHSYRLLDKYAHYHDRLLGALCVFRPGTAQVLKRLHQEKSAGRQLMELYRQEEPRAWMLPPMPESNQQILQERISKVVDQINRCESRYSQRTPEGHQ